MLHVYPVLSSILRDNYLTNGGSDPDILAKMSQMQSEAKAIEDSTTYHMNQGFLSQYFY